jgi:hypothetical protein
MEEEEFEEFEGDEGLDDEEEEEEVKPVKKSFKPLPKTTIATPQIIKTQLKKPVITKPVTKQVQ